MKIFLTLILSVVLCFSAVAQTTNHMDAIKIANTDLTIRAGTGTNIGLVLPNVYVTFSGTERERFIKFIDIHIKLLEEVSKNGLYDDSTKDIVSYEPFNKITISTSLKLKGEGYILFHVNSVASYKIIYLTKQNLLDMKEAFNKVYDFIKKIEVQSAEVEKLILDAKLSFNS